MITDGPVGFGTKWRETRRMYNQRSVDEWEMTAFESSDFFSAYSGSHGYDVNRMMRVEPEREFSRLALEMTTRPRAFIGKLGTPVEWFMSGMMKSIVRKDLESTKAYIERNSTT